MIIRILIEVETTLSPGSIAGPITEFADNMEGVCVRQVRQVAAVPETVSEARSVASLARKTFSGPRRHVSGPDYTGLTVRAAREAGLSR